MTTFYFDVKVGNQSRIFDFEGVELSDRLEAQEHAIKAAADLLRLERISPRFPLSIAIDVRTASVEGPIVTCILTLNVTTGACARELK